MSYYSEVLGGGVGRGGPDFDSAEEARAAGERANPNARQEQQESAERACRAAGGIYYDGDMGQNTRPDKCYKAAGDQRVILSRQAGMTTGEWSQRATDVRNHLTQKKECEDKGGTYEQEAPPWGAEYEGQTIGICRGGTGTGGGGGGGDDGYVGDSGGGGADPFTPDPDDPTSTCPPGEERYKGRCWPACAPGQVRGITGGCTSEASTEALRAEVNEAAGPLPEPFRPSSLADVLKDPRYATAAREQDETIRAAGAAGGVRGPALLSALSRGRQDLLSGLSSMIHGQDLQAYGANLDRSREAFDRAWGPTQFALSHGLQREGLQAGVDQDYWGRLMGLRRHAWDRERFGRGLAHDRWRVGQNNAYGILSGILNQQPLTIAAPGF